MSVDRDEIKRLCQEWKGRLGLAHWNIDADIVRGVELEGEYFHVSTNFERESASVRIICLEDYHWGTPLDMEQALVRGLLYVVFAPARHAYDAITTDMLRDPFSGEFFEQAIDRMARVLVKLKREKVSDKVGEKVGD